MPDRRLRQSALLTVCGAVGLLLVACQPGQGGTTAAPTQPAATAKPAASPPPLASPAIAASPAPTAVPKPIVPSPAAAASPSPSPAAGGNASAELRNASGALVGTALLSQTGNKVRLQVKVADLPAGEHGIHVHAVGRCDPPDFASAGGHFNPTTAQHGLQNPQGPHAGDLPNFKVEQNGTGQYDQETDRLSLQTGPNSVFDADGSAVVVHAGPDDMRSDPAGNSGARIACGIVRRS